MLPFLTKKKQQNTGISMVYRTPDEKEMSQDDSEAGLDAAAEDLLRGMHSHDKKLVIAAVKAMFEILDALPHKEYSHEESDENL